MKKLVAVGAIGIAVLAAAAMLAIYLLTQPGAGQPARASRANEAPAAAAQPPAVTLSRPLASPVPPAASPEPVAAPVAPPVAVPSAPPPVAPGADGSWVDRAAAMPGYKPERDRLGAPRPGPAWDAGDEDQVRPAPPPPNAAGRFSRRGQPPAQ